MLSFSSKMLKSMAAVQFHTSEAQIAAQLQLCCVQLSGQHLSDCTRV